jgi:hypothetical protein
MHLVYESAKKSNIADLCGSSDGMVTWIPSHIDVRAQGDKILPRG